MSSSVTEIAHTTIHVAHSTINIAHSTIHIAPSIVKIASSIINVTSSIINVTPSVINVTPSVIVIIVDRRFISKISGIIVGFICVRRILGGWGLRIPMHVSSFRGGCFLLPPQGRITLSVATGRVPASATVGTLGFVTSLQRKSFCAISVGIGVKVTIGSWEQLGTLIVWSGHYCIAVIVVGVSHVVVVVIGRSFSVVVLVNVEKWVILRDGLDILFIHRGVFP